MRLIAEFLHAILDNRFAHWILLWILKKWQVNDSVPEEGTDVTCLISCSAHQDGLTSGSELTLALAGGNTLRNRKTLVLWGIFRNPLQEVERREKESALRDTDNICVGDVTSSTDECEAMLEVLRELGKPIHSLLVVPEACHSRRDRLVWKWYLKKYFPKAVLYFRSADAEKSADPRNPMFLQRYWEVWLIFNIMFYPLYRWFPGVGWFAKRNFHQAAS